MRTSTSARTFANLHATRRCANVEFSSSGYRKDVQSLRGLAVLMVLVYHFRLPPISGGYLGVDVFFVISGFLITSLIVRDADAGMFAFGTFYLHRARRLLPAAYATLILCLAVSPVLLTESQMRDFVAQLTGAALFAANVVLWMQTGYFEHSATVKPLLHFWSLSIEEQYYALIPAMLLLLGRRYRLLGVALVTLCSAVLCFLFVESKPGASFYLLPTRAWELGLGSMLALLMLNPSIQLRIAALNGRFFFAAQILSIAIIVGLAVRPIGDSRPGVDALLICLATAALLTAPFRYFVSGLPAALLSRIGDISYSLYLVHWPIVAYLNAANVNGAGVGWPMRFAGFLLAWLVAILLYKYVEQSFRGRSGAPKKLSPVHFLVAGVLLVVMAFGVAAWSSTSTNFAERLRGNSGLHPSCAQETGFAAMPDCETSANPKLALWGDSYAMHWAPGLAAQGASFAQWTRSTCAPASNIALNDGAKSLEWGRSCIEFNEQVLSHLVRSDVEVVALSALWGYLVSGSHTVKSDAGYEKESADRSRFERQLELMIVRLRKSGKRVVLLMPPPTNGFDIGACQERKVTGKFAFGAPGDCRIDASKARENRAMMLASVLAAASRTGVNVIDPFPWFCDQYVCETERDGMILYRDTGHLSVEGSIVVAKHVDLVAQIFRDAR
jgi:peptidoglycan/LPS O-acetylase OafA/YrhL